MSTACDATRDMRMGNGNPRGRLSARQGLLRIALRPLEGVWPLARDNVARSRRAMMELSKDGVEDRGGKRHGAGAGV